MLHAKFQDYRSSGSGEDILQIFTIYGRGGHLGHVTMTIYKKKKLLFPLLKEAPHERRRCLNIVDDDDGRTTTDAGAWVYYKLTL